MKKQNNKGFSLVELIVVVAIMAVLVGVLAPALLTYVEKSRTQKDESAAAEVLHAVEIAIAEEDVYSEIANGTTVTVADGAVVASDVDALETALVAIFPNAINFDSQTHNNGTYTITIAINATTKAVTVTGAWS